MVVVVEVVVEEDLRQNLDNDLGQKKNLNQLKQEKKNCLLQKDLPTHFLKAQLFEQKHKMVQELKYLLLDLQLFAF